MPQFPKIIDVSQGYFPCDPNSFPENLHYTGQEDSPVKTSPVLLYDGWNILPTAYGYRSYFGLTSKIDVTALTTRCDGLLVFQTSTYSNKIFAMCEDGLWTLSGGTWTHSYTLSTPAPGSHLEWTWCIIENILYIYRQANTVVYKVIADGTLSSFTPSFLTMAGQMGIFRANGRLGFWDSANSVSWSSVLDHTDFTPSLETLAGNRIFNAVIGRIVVIRAKSDGFVIYCTRRIVGVRYITTGTLLWDADAITDDIGIAYPKQSTTGITDSDQYFYGGGALYAIGQYNQVSKSTQLVPVFPEIVDFLRETRDPVFLEFFGGRYLYLYLIDNRYIDGMVHFEEHTVPTLSLEVLPGWDGTLADMPLSLTQIELVQALYQVFNGNTAEQQTTKPPGGKKPIWSISTTRYDANFLGIFAANYGAWGPGQLSKNNAMEYMFDGIANGDEFIAKAVIEAAIDNNTKSYSDTGFYPTRASAGARAVKTVSEMHNVIQSQWYELNERIKGIVYNLTNYSIQTSESDNSIAGGYYYVGDYNSLIASPPDLPDASLINWTTGKGPVSIYTRPGRVTVRKHLTEGYQIRKYQSYVSNLAGGMNYSGSSDPATFQFSITAGFSCSIPFSVNPYIYSYGIDLSFAGLLAAYADASYRMRQNHTFLAASITGFPSTMNVYLTEGKVLAGKNLVLHTVHLEHTDPAEFAKYGKFLYQRNAKVFSYNTSTKVAAPVDAYIRHTYICDFYTTIYNNCLNTHVDTIFTITHWADVSDVFLAATGVYAGGPESGEYCNKEGMVSFTNPSVGAGVNRYDTGLPFPLSYLDPYLDYPSYSIEFPALSTISYPPYTLDLPGATFNLQDGSIGPIYPTYVGALVYDLALKKWGKFKGQFKQLIEYSPVNKVDEGIITYDNFGMDVGVLDTSGYLRLFDLNPSDSLAKWGKIGYYRAGFTRASEVIIHFRLPSTCTIKLEHSIDGRAINSDLTKETTVTSALSARFGLDVVGVWFNIVLAGQFDVQYIEFRAFPQGIR
jgi:hypothetical protein